MVVVVVLFSACAARQRHPSNRFVKRGAPSAEPEKPPAVDPRSFETYVARVRKMAVTARKNPPQAPIPTVEARDAILSAALLRVVIEPTAAAHRRAAERYRDLGILDAAFDHFQQATRIDPADAAAYEGLARAWRDWGFPQLGIADADRAVYFAPRSAAAHNTLGTLLTALGLAAEARRAYERAIALDPQAAYALNNLCYLSFLEGNPSRSAVECRAALSIDPQLTAARNNLALVHAAAGRTDAATRDFLAAAHSAAAGFYNIGIAQMAAKHYAAAVAAFDAARRARPAWPAAQARMRQARRLLDSSPASE